MLAKVKAKHWAKSKTTLPMALRLPAAMVLVLDFKPTKCRKFCVGCAVTLLYLVSTKLYAAAAAVVMFADNFIYFILCPVIVVKDVGAILLPAAKLLFVFVGCCCFNCSVFW